MTKQDEAKNEQQNKNSRKADCAETKILVLYFKAINFQYARKLVMASSAGAQAPHMNFTFGSNTATQYELQ